MGHTSLQGSEDPVAKSSVRGTRVTGADRDALTAQLRREYEGGASIRELARQTGRSYGFVHQLLGEAGVELRGRGGATRRKDGG
jgi:predicted transcriptional regulator